MFLQRGVRLGALFRYYKGFGHILDGSRLNFAMPNTVFPQILDIFA